MNITQHFKINFFTQKRVLSVSNIKININAIYNKRSIIFLKLYYLYFFLKIFLLKKFKIQKNLTRVSMLKEHLQKNIYKNHHTHNYVFLA